MGFSPNSKTQVSERLQRTSRIKAQGASRNERQGNTRLVTKGEGDTAVHFRFLGVIGASNLDKASESTIRLDNLAMARDMELAKKDAKAIKYATGWERGIDGKWRYETEDGKLRFSSFWYSSATYLVGGSQSSSGKTKESFSIEKKRIA